MHGNYMVTTHWHLVQSIHGSSLEQSKRNAFSNNLHGVEVYVSPFQNGFSWPSLSCLQPRISMGLACRVLVLLCQGRKCLMIVLRFTRTLHPVAWNSVACLLWQHCPKSRGKICRTLPQFYRCQGSFRGLAHWQQGKRLITAPTSSPPVSLEVHYSRGAPPFWGRAWEEILGMVVWRSSLR